MSEAPDFGLPHARARAFQAAARALGCDPQGLRDLMSEPESSACFEAIPEEAGAEFEGETVEDVMWAELEHLERRASPHGDVHGRGQVQYYLRRRELLQRRRWETAATSLPRPWRRLAEQSAGAVRERCIELGAVLVAAGGHGMPSTELRKWLIPLGDQMARRVAEKILEAASLPADALSPIGRDAYAGVRASGRRGSSILSRIGRRLLATLYREIPEERRRDAGEVGRSNVLEILGSEQAYTLESDEQRERAAQLVDAALDFGG